MCLQLNNVSLPCTVCWVAHTVARCPVPAAVGKTDTASIVLTTGGRSTSGVYSFSKIMQSPVLNSISPTVMDTSGGNRLLTIQGSEMKDRGTVLLVNTALNMTLPCRGPAPGDSTGACDGSGGFECVLRWNDELLRG